MCGPSCGVTHVTVTAMTLKSVCFNALRNIISLQASILYSYPRYIILTVGGLALITIYMCTLTLPVHVYCISTLYSYS